MDASKSLVPKVFLAVASNFTHSILYNGNYSFEMQISSVEGGIEAKEIV